MRCTTVTLLVALCAVADVFAGEVAHRYTLRGVDGEWIKELDTSTLASPIGIDRDTDLYYRLEREKPGTQSFIVCRSIVDDHLLWKTPFELERGGFVRGLWCGDSRWVVVQAGTRWIAFDKSLGTAEVSSEFSTPAGWVVEVQGATREEHGFFVMGQDLQSLSRLDPRTGRILWTHPVERADRSRVLQLRRIHWGWVEGTIDAETGGTYKGYFDPVTGTFPQRLRHNAATTPSTHLSWCLSGSQEWLLSGTTDVTLRCFHRETSQLLWSLGRLPQASRLLPPEVSSNPHGRVVLIDTGESCIVVDAASGHRLGDFAGKRHYRERLIEVDGYLVQVTPDWVRVRQLDGEISWQCPEDHVDVDSVVCSDGVLICARRVGEEDTSLTQHQRPFRWRITARALRNATPKGDATTQEGGAGIESVRAGEMVWDYPVQRPTRFFDHFGGIHLVVTPSGIVEISQTIVYE